MAYSSHPTSAPFGANLLQTVVAALKSVGTFLAGVNHSMMVNSAAHMNLQKVERLQAMTDEELAARGIKREDIVHKVFGHYL